MDEATTDWKPGFRMWEYQAGNIYEVEGGEFVASYGGVYLPGTFPSHHAAKSALIETALTPMRQMPPHA